MEKLLALRVIKLGCYFTYLFDCKFVINIYLIKFSVIPRLLFDRWSGQDYLRLFKERIRVQELGAVIFNALHVQTIKTKSQTIEML